MTTGIAPAYATGRFSGYETAQRTLDTNASKPAEPEATTKKHVDHVHIRVPQQNIASVDDWLTVAPGFPTGSTTEYSDSSSFRYSAATAPAS